MQLSPAPSAIEHLPPLLKLLIQNHLILFQQQKPRPWEGDKKAVLHWWLTSVSFLFELDVIG